MNKKAWKSFFIVLGVLIFSTGFLGFIVIGASGASLGMLPLLLWCMCPLGVCIIISCSCHWYGIAKFGMEYWEGLPQLWRQFAWHTTFWSRYIIARHEQKESRLEDDIWSTMAKQELAFYESCPRFLRFLHFPTVLWAHMVLAHAEKEKRAHESDL